ncbi:MAG: L,D-transpeptidase family protein [Planctomycetes bacterium]|nr:L,D-transpeptidase family protein [Planctomycetota bacterium]
MRILLLLVALAALAAGGWWWFGHTPQSENPFTPSAPEAQPAPALPAAAQQALAEADALWQQAGPQPTTAPRAPRIARLYSEALRALYDIPGQHDREERLLSERLAPLAQALFFSPTRWTEDESGLMAVHTVSAGQTPDGIARHYGMSQEFLNRLRGKPPTASDLRVGETLKVVRVRDCGGYHIDIDLSDFTLDLFIGGVFAKRYIIAHGAKETPTPTGETRLVNRVWHPQWTHPTKKTVFEYGHPENILGPVWLPFDAELLGASGIGIHGYTGADAQLRAQVSNGCIRMQNQDVEELYQLLAHPQRTPTTVRIRP